MNDSPESRGYGNGETLADDPIDQVLAGIAVNAFARGEEGSPHAQRK